MEQPYVSHVVITRMVKVSRTGGDSRLYVEFNCCTSDISDGYILDPNFPDKDELANGSIQIVTDEPAINVWDESSQTFKEWTDE